MKKILLTMVVFLATTITFAQRSYQDVVYLKNGSIIRGTIIEQIPDESLKIKTADGSLFVIKISEVEDMAKERITTPNTQAATPVQQQNMTVQKSTPKQVVVIPPSTAELKQKMALNAPYLYEKYKYGSTLSKVGMGLTLGGFAVAVVGYAVADKRTETNGMTTTTYISGPGAVIGGTGVLCILAGTPTWIVGGVKKRNARKAYLKEFGYAIHEPVNPSPHLQLNTALNGLGLAFVF